MTTKIMWLVTLLTLISLSACNEKNSVPTSPQSPFIVEETQSGAFFIRTNELSDSQGMALFGYLTQVGNCLRLTSGDSEKGTLLVWQTNTQIVENEDQFEIVNIHGLPPIHIGAALALSGNHMQLPDEWREFLPDGCKEGPYFMATEGVTSTMLGSSTERGYAIGPDPVLVGIDWKLVELNNKQLPDDFIPIMRFTSEGAEGYTGCNKWTSIGKMITNGFFFLPFMAAETGGCNYPELQQEFSDSLLFESQFYDVLNSQLVISNNDGNVVLLFAQQ